MSVPDEMLEFNDDQSCLFEGKLFTGLAFRDFPDGSRESETEYLDGFQTGHEKRWARNGILVADYSFLKGELHGESREWYEAGQLKSEAQYELGIELAYRSWDESGNLEVNRRLEAGTPHERMLNQKRAAL
ncbi:putative antitoxin YwqK [Rubritalea halochordaticola]|uniref:Antitoxin YwqK n=1 Tax=Rubritalea halochordaticola TaxID=714537 RepID=A0ABP9V3A4_9BACT